MTAKMTELRRRRTEAGFCWACGLIAPAEGKKICWPCFEHRQETDKIRRAKYKEQGLCPKCLKPSETDKQICSMCMSLQVDEMRDRRKENKEFIYKHFGSKCARCNETDIVVMTLDHVNNDGFHDKKSKSGKKQITPTWYAKLVKQIKAGLPLERELQMLCFNCHAKKDLTPWWMRNEP